MKFSLALLPFICLCLTGCFERGSGDYWPFLFTRKAPKEPSTEFWDGRGLNDEDFIALDDEDLRTQFVDDGVPQPKSEPGMHQSIVPGIEGFASPSGFEMAIFKNLHFNTDEHVLRSKDDLSALDAVAEYLSAHPNVFLFIEGHCDERGPEAYNLSLGTRRANTVRAQLVKRGIDPERLHSISYGKERPVAYGHDSDSWTKNRRAEFKLFKR